MRKFLGLLAPIAVLGACATATSDREPSPEVQAKLSEFERTGDVESCIPLSRTSSIDPLDDYRFLIRQGSRYFLSEMNGRCNGAARFSNRLEYKTSLSSLCRNEIVRVVDNGSNIPSGSCSFGGFERLEKIEVAEESE